MTGNSSLTAPAQSLDQAPIGVSVLACSSPYCSSLFRLCYSYASAEHLFSMEYFIRLNSSWAAACSGPGGDISLTPFLLQQGTVWCSCTEPAAAYASPTWAFPQPSLHAILQHSEVCTVAGRKWILEGLRRLCPVTPCTDLEGCRPETALHWSVSVL